MSENDQSVPAADPKEDHETPGGNPAIEPDKADEAGVKIENAENVTVEQPETD